MDVSDEIAGSKSGIVPATDLLVGPLRVAIFVLGEGASSGLCREVRWVRSRGQVVEKVERESGIKREIIKKLRY